MGIGVLTITEASKVSGIPKRTLHRWLVARATVDPRLITKLTAKKWLINRAALAEMLGLDVTSIETALERHGKDIDSLKRRVKALETRRA